MDPLPVPAAGQLLAQVVGYVKRRTAVRQAVLWNRALRDSPPSPSGSRYVVEVGDRDPDGTWKLVWSETSER